MSTLQGFRESVKPVWVFVFLSEQFFIIGSVYLYAQIFICPFIYMFRVSSCVSLDGLCICSSLSVFLFVLFGGAVLSLWLQLNFLLLLI